MFHVGSQQQSFSRFGQAAGSELILSLQCVVLSSQMCTVVSFFVS